MSGALATPLWSILALFALVAAAAAIHRLGGQGFGTLVAPFAALIAPEHTPATVLLLGVLVTLLGVGLEFRDIRLGEIAPAVAGRLAGTLPAIWVVGAAAGSTLLGPVIGGVILLGVALSLAGLSVRRTRATLFAAGALSGFTGTLTSVGAAPMGMIYQNEAARRARSTLNAFFLIGVTLSVLGLVAAGLVRRAHLEMAALLAPAVLLGVRAAGPLARRIEGAPLKPISLGLAAFAALLLIGKALW